MQNIPECYQTEYNFRYEDDVEEIPEDKDEDEPLKGNIKLRCNLDKLIPKIHRCSNPLCLKILATSRKIRSKKNNYCDSQCAFEGKEFAYRRRLLDRQKIKCSLTT